MRGRWADDYVTLVRAYNMYHHDWRETWRTWVHGSLVGVDQTIYQSSTDPSTWSSRLGRSNDNTYEVYNSIHTGHNSLSPDALMLPYSPDFPTPIKCV